MEKGKVRFSTVLSEDIENKESKQTGLQDSQKTHLLIDIDFKVLICFPMQTTTWKHGSIHTRIEGADLTFPTIEGTEPATLARHTK